MNAMYWVEENNEIFKLQVKCTWTYPWGGASALLFSLSGLNDREMPDNADFSLSKSLYCALVVRWSYYKLEDWLFLLVKKGAGAVKNRYKYVHNNILLAFINNKPLGINTTFDFVDSKAVIELYKAVLWCAETFHENMQLEKTMPYFW